MNFKRFLIYECPEGGTVPWWMGDAYHPLGTFKWVCIPVPFCFAVRAGVWAWRLWNNVRLIRSITEDALRYRIRELEDTTEIPGLKRRIAMRDESLERADKELRQRERTSLKLCGEIRQLQRDLRTAKKEKKDADIPKQDAD